VKEKLLISFAAMARPTRSIWTVTTRSTPNVGTTYGLGDGGPSVWEEVSGPLDVRPGGRVFTAELVSENDRVAHRRVANQLLIAQLLGLEIDCSSFDPTCNGLTSRHDST
jgi:hypothetical protein